MYLNEMPFLHREFTPIVCRALSLRLPNLEKEEWRERVAKNIKCLRSTSLKPLLFQTEMHKLRRPRLRYAKLTDVLLQFPEVISRDYQYLDNARDFIGQSKQLAHEPLLANVAPLTP